MSDNTTTKDKERVPFKIDFDPLPFDTIANSKFISSNELCKIASDVFKSIFADCEGTRFEVSNNQFYIGVIFNHAKYNTNPDDENRDIVACAIDGDIKKTSSNVVNVIRGRDSRMINGDRYVITEDGKDIFMNLLTIRQFNNGNPNWNQIVSDFSEQQVRGYYNFMSGVPQYTIIRFIDVGNLCKFIFGSEVKDEHGNKTDDHYDYHANIITPINQFGMISGMSTNNYMLNITRVSDKNVRKLYADMGMGTIANIIR